MSILSQSDRFNPVFLKEIRQTLHGSTVPLVLLVELLVLLACSGFGLVRGVGHSGTNVLALQLSLISWLAGWSLVSLALKRLAEERQAQQAELIFLSRVTVGSYLRGLWLACMAVGLLPQLAAIPFWTLGCGLLGIPWQMAATWLGMQALAMALLLSMQLFMQVDLIRSAQPSLIILESAFLGLGLVPCLAWVVFNFCSNPFAIDVAIRVFHSLDCLVACLLVAAVCLLVYFLGLAWLRLTACVVPGSQTGVWARRSLRVVLILSAAVIGIPYLWVVYRAFGLFAASLWMLFIVWIGGRTFQRLGQARVAPAGLASRFLAACSWNKPAGDPRLRLAFIDGWRCFDKANPIFVKELRQALHSGSLPTSLGLAFLTGFFALLIPCNQCSYGDNEYGIVLMFLLAGMLFSVPGAVVFGTIAEAQADAYSLVQATTLTPGQVVRGKWGMMAVWIAAVLLGVMPHGLLWGWLTGRLGLVLVVLGAFAMVAWVVSLALLILALFPINLTAYLLFFCGMLWWWAMFILHIRDLSFGTVLGRGWQPSAAWLALPLLAGLMAGCLYQLAVVVVRRRQALARWLALATLAVLAAAALLAVGSEITLAISVLGLLVLAAWIPWHLWSRRRLVAGGWR